MDDKKFSVTLNMYFGVYWTEDRLFISTEAKEQVSSWLPIDRNFMRHLWVPNVFVYNLVSFHALECLEKLAGLWVVGPKRLFYNQVYCEIYHLKTIETMLIASKLKLQYAKNKSEYSAKHTVKVLNDYDAYIPQ